MKFRILIVCAVALVAACTDNDGRSDESSAPLTVATEPATDRVAMDLYSRLPDKSITLGFPFTMKSDKTIALDNGASRRGIAIEYRDMGPEQVWAGLDSSLRNSGYELVGVRVQDNAKGSQRYSKQGMPSLIFSVSPKPESGIGTIWIGWQLSKGTAADQDK